jgi:hypothetical protein
MWMYMRSDPGLVQYALYVAILADLCAAVPTFKHLYNDPLEDRPIAWGIFAFGYGLALFAVPEYTFANCVLPVYMTLGSTTVMCILASHRIKHNIPIKEWF